MNHYNFQRSYTSEEEPVKPITSPYVSGPKEYRKNQYIKYPSFTRINEQLYSVPKSSNIDQQHNVGIGLPINNQTTHVLKHFPSKSQNESSVFLDEYSQEDQNERNEKHEDSDEWNNRNDTFNTSHSKHRSVLGTRHPSATFKNIGIRKPNRQSSSSNRKSKRNKEQQHPEFESESDKESIIASPLRQQSPSSENRLDRNEKSKNENNQLCISLKAELETIQNTLNASITGIQITVQNLMNKLSRLESSMRTKQNDQMDDILLTLQHLKDQTRWFWAKVLPNSNKKVDIYFSLPIDEQQNRCVKGQRYSIDAGKWLRCCYPPRDAVDDQGHMFKWLRVQSINRHTAQITDYWVKAYDVLNDVHLLGEFKFRSPEPDFSILDRIIKEKNRKNDAIHQSSSTLVSETEKKICDLNDISNSPNYNEEKEQIGKKLGEINTEQIHAEHKI